MLANEAVNASRMIDMHISVYEAKCATTHSHISVYGQYAVRSRDIGARISNWIIYYLLTQYIFLHFLQPRVMLDCELAPRHIRLAAPLNCPHTINSLVFFRIGQLISNIFSMCVPCTYIHCRIILYEKRTRHFLLPIVHYDFLALRLLSTDQHFYRRCGQTVQRQIILASRRENVAFVVSRLILPGVSPKPYARMESHDTRIRINVGTLSRSRSASSRRKREYRGRIAEQRCKR